MHRAVIVSMARTPIGCLGSSLVSMRAPQLGAIAIKGALSRVSANSPFSVGEVIMGNVVSANVGQAPARQASKGAASAGAKELSDSVVCTTVNKVCSSGLKAISLASQSIILGHHDVCVAGGMESMSNAPYYLPAQTARFNGLRFGHGQVLDSLTRDGLWDPYNECNMGICAEKTAKDMVISRAEQDAYAIESYKRTQAANKSGIFASEIVSVKLPTEKGSKSAKSGAKEVEISVDEEFSRFDEGKMSSLKPAFISAELGGTVTVANSSKINDGAAALVLMSEAKAKALGLTPLARIMSSADFEHAPMDFPTAPAGAITLALARAGVKLSDVDYHEINEAFALVALANAKTLSLDLTRVNVHGGAVALGHPIGCSGARIVMSLISVLKAKNGKIGVASICNGGGGATAMVIERLS